MAKRKQSKAAKSRKSGGRKQVTRPRRRSARRTSGPSGAVLKLATQAREMARGALGRLREEIRDAEKRLEKLVASERSFRMDLFGDGSPARGRRPAGTPKRSKPRRKGPPRADAFFKRLPRTFTLDDVRKVAGRLTGVSLAQWGRSKKVKKVGKGKYQKAA